MYVPFVSAVLHVRNVAVALRNDPPQTPDPPRAGGRARRGQEEKRAATYLVLEGDVEHEPAGGPGLEALRRRLNRSYGLYTDLDVPKEEPERASPDVRRHEHLGAGTGLYGRRDRRRPRCRPAPV